MKAILALGLTFLGGAAAAAAGPAVQPLTGTWEYRQPNQGMPDGYDSEGERLLLKSEGGKLQGFYFGLEREGEEGLYYTAVEVRDLNVNGAEISFTVPGRKFYYERPGSMAAAKAGKLKEAGMTRTELKMAGKLEGGSLTLHCRSKDSTCPADVLPFKKVR